MEFPVFIYWGTGTNPESNNVIVMFANEEELGKIFPENVDDSFLGGFYHDEAEYYYADEFMKYYKGLTKLSLPEAITEIKSYGFPHFSDDFESDNTFYVFNGKVALDMFSLLNQRCLRITNEYVDLDKYLEKQFQIWVNEENTKNEENKENEENEE